MASTKASTSRSSSARSSRSIGGQSSKVLAGEVLLVDVVEKAKHGDPLVSLEKVDTSPCRVAVVIAIAGISSAEGTVFLIGAKDDVDCFGVATVVKARQTALIGALV